MNTNRKTATIVGVLFLISYFGVFAGAAFLTPLLDSPDYLTNFYPHKTEVMIGILLEMVNGIAVVGIAVMLFPLLKHYHEGLALGYISMRILEGAMQTAMDFSPLSLLTLSREYIAAGDPDTSRYQTLGTLILEARESAGLLLLIFFSLGAVLFYYLLYQSKLVPRLIPVWGVIAVALIVTMNLFEIGMPIGMILALPIIANELFLAGWLIVKGFDSSAIVSGSA